jgi:hypothetical protein
MHYSPVSIEELVKEIRTINRSGATDIEVLIEQYLEHRLQGVSTSERPAIIENLVRQFKAGSTEAASALRVESRELSRLFSLLLGKKVSVEDFSSEEISDKLASALSTVFDTLNRIISVIHSTLLGQKAEIETIRHIIGSQLEGERGTSSLQEYLDQIQEAFLVAHKSFQSASRNKIEQILSELDPEKIASSVNAGLKFGPLKKAEIFEAYKEKYTAIRTWLDSGRLMTELLREFEKNCQKTYKTLQGGNL